MGWKMLEVGPYEPVFAMNKERDYYLTMLACCFCIKYIALNSSA